MGKIQVISGDITKQKADAIVNAANKSLLSGGGVDGAIHRAAGNILETECRELGACPVGEARITKSYNLEQAGIGWIIHAVGPIWLGGYKEEEKLLENAYKSSLNFAKNYSDIYPKQCLKVLEKHLNGLDEEKKNKVRDEVLEEARVYIEKHPIKTIAFPSISTGIYHFPLEKAAATAVNVIKKFMEKETDLEKIMIICFDEKTYNCYTNII